MEKEYVVYWVSTNESGRHGETSIVSAMNFSDAYNKAYKSFPEVVQVVSRSN